MGRGDRTLGVQLMSATMDVISWRRSRDQQRRLHFWQSDTNASYALVNSTVRTGKCVSSATMARSKSRGFQPIPELRRASRQGRVGALDLNMEGFVDSVGVDRCHGCRVAGNSSHQRSASRRDDSRNVLVVAAHEAGRRTAVVGRREVAVQRMTDRPDKLPVGKGPVLDCSSSCDSFVRGCPAVERMDATHGSRG